MRIRKTRNHSRKLTLFVALFAAMAMLALGGAFVSALPGPAVAPGMQTTPAALPQRGVVGGEGAGLRDAPGGPVTETLPLAAALWITGRTDDNAWLQVELADGRSGWVQGDEVVAFGLELVPVLDVAVQAEATPAASAPSEKGAAALTARVNTRRRNLNLRRGPATSYGIVGVAKPGEELTVVGRDEQGDWLLVTLPDSEDVVWAAARYLDVAGDLAGLPINHQPSQARIVSSASGRRDSTTGLAGKLVFQTSSGGPIMVYDLTTGKSRQLTTGLDPAISPDGQTVAFIRDGGGDAGLYLIDIDGRNERRIFIESKLRTPAWSPDGQWIAFQRVTGEDTCRDVGHGVCLPDAPWLVQFPLIIYDIQGLSRVDRTGGRFTDIPAEPFAHAPDWGDRGILYQSRSGVQMTDASPGATPRPVIMNPHYSDPAWRPGTGILALVGKEKDHHEIFRVNDDGSGLTALTHPGDFIENPRAIQHVAPAWSPDGQHIVYLSDETGDWALYVMDADGGNQRKLPIDAAIAYQFQGEQVVDWGR